MQPAERTRKYSNIELSDEDVMTIEVFIEEHGVACLLDFVAQSCHNKAVSKDTSAQDFHINSMICGVISNQLEKIERLEKLNEELGF